MIGLILFLLAFYWYFVPKYRYLAIFILFYFVTGGFQLIPIELLTLEKAGVTKCFDWTLYFVGIVFFFQPQIFFKKDVWFFNKALIYFFIVLFIMVLYSIYYIHSETSIAIRVARNYLFFILMFLSIPMKIEDHKKVFRLIVYFTSAASFFYCLQPFVGKIILNAVAYEPFFIIESGIKRFFNNPVYLFPTLICFIIDKETLKIKFLPFLVIINLGALFLSQHRSMILCFALCYVLNIFLSKKEQIGKVILITGLGVVGFLVGDQLLGGRFTNGIQDIKEGRFKIKDIKYITTNELPLLSTTDFRYFHFVERATYVLEDPIRTVFGVGMITEDSKITKTLHFTVGTTGEDNENVPQVSTGDISWSLLVLNMGFLGIASFLFLELSFLKKFFHHRKDQILRAGLFSLFGFLITSFYGTYSIQPFTFCITALFVSYAYRLEKDNQISN